MSLPTRRNRVLGPERAIQEMTPRERRARHARHGRDARAEGSRVRPASAHTEREHTIEHYGFHIKRNETDYEDSVGGYARVAMKALAVVWHVRCESERGGLTPSSVRRYRKTIEGWQGPKRKTAW